MKLVWFLMIVFVHKSIQDDEDTVVVGVTRRLLLDIYFDHTDNHKTCSEDSKVIYLVEDRQCVTEQDLLKGKQNFVTTSHNIHPYCHRMQLCNNPSEFNPANCYSKSFRIVKYLYIGQSRRRSNISF